LQQVVGEFAFLSHLIFGWDEALAHEAFDNVDEGVDGLLVTDHDVYLSLT